MADELDDVFQSGAMAEPEPQPDPVPEPEPVVEEPQGESEPEPQPEVVEPDKPEPGHVPLAALMDERDKRKEERAAREAAEARLRELEQRQAPQQIPDALDDPQGFQAYLDHRDFTNRLNTSYLIAQQSHGAETVNAAKEWAQERAASDPVFDAEIARQPHPLEWIVQQHKREALLSDIGPNVDDWFTREAAKRGYVAQSEATPAAVASVVPKQVASPARAPRSLASQGTSPSDIRHVPSGPLSAVDAVFN